MEELREPTEVELEQDINFLTHILFEIRDSISEVKIETGLGFFGHVEDFVLEFEHFLIIFFFGNFGFFDVFLFLGIRKTVEDRFPES